MRARDDYVAWNRNRRRTCPLLTQLLAAHFAMALEDEFHDALLSMYRRAGEEAGYWGTRFLQAVRRKGGLATAKDMLTPRTSAQRAGLEKLLEAGRPDLTLESVVLEPKFQALFTEPELREAATRLGRFESEAAARDRERLYPDELEPGIKYPEGLRKQVRVNAFERNRRARRACLNAHGTRCSVCSVSFEERYGSIGSGFIHVHHIRPLPTVGPGYKVDPLEDLIPVCPNCHAMMHRREPPLTVEEVKARLRQDSS